MSLMYVLFCVLCVSVFFIYFFIYLFIYLSARHHANGIIGFLSLSFHEYW